jgi:hypothetical protein
MSTKQDILEQTIGQPIDLAKWQERTRDGWLVNLDIRHGRATKKLTFEELGITASTDEAKTAYASLLSPGMKRLLPKAPIMDLETIARGAREHLKEYTYDTPFGKFFPRTAYKRWSWGLWRDGSTTISGEAYFDRYGSWYTADEDMFEDELDGDTGEKTGWIVWKKPQNMVKPGNEFYRYRFFATRDEIVKRFDALITQVEAEYQYVARETYRLDSAQREEHPSESDFFEHFLNAHIRSHYKPARSFAQTCIYQEIFLEITLSSPFEAKERTLNDVGNIYTQREAEIAAAQERKQMLDAENRDLVRKVRQQKEAMIDSFVTSLVVQLRNLTYEAVTSVLTSIKKNNTLQGRPVIQLLDLIAQIRHLNFYSDQDIDAILTTLHGIIDTPAKDRNISDITRQLQRIGTLTRGTILALGETPREGKDIKPEDIGIPDQPTDEDIREAREEIREVVSTLELPEAEREEREESVVPTGSMLIPEVLEKFSTMKLSEIEQLVNEQSGERTE